MAEPSNKRWIGRALPRMRIAVMPVRSNARESEGACRRRSLPLGCRGALCLLSAFAAGHVTFTGCDYNEYPAEATFCDDWCQVLRRTGCDQEPENCVRDCESALPSDSCFPLQASLLECYQSVPADRFECVAQGFQSTVRPSPEICTEQRHALIRCEVPRVMQCIEACAALDTSDPASRSGDAGVVPSGAEAARCPEPPFPCERLCWELDARFGRGQPTTLRDIDRTDDTDLRAVGEPLIRCARERAATCRADLQPQGARASAGVLPGRLSWTSAFLECAGLPADLGALD